jgi:PAS domain S-box-containing protein
VFNPENYQFDVLEKVFESTSVIMILKDLNNNLLRCNDYSAKLIGLDKADLIGKNFTEIFPKDANRLFNQDQEIINTKKSVVGEIIQVRLFDDSDHWCRRDKIPLLSKEGEITSILIMAQDITEQMKAEREVNDLISFAEVGLRTAEIIHSLKNPIMIAIGQVNALEDKFGGKFAPVAKLHKAHDQIQEIVKEVLDISVTDDYAKKAEFVSIKELLLEALDITYLRDDVTLEIGNDIHEHEDLFVKISPSHFKQIIQNLIENAQDALFEVKDDRQKQISIKLQKVGKFAAISIEDNGVGIEAKYLENIFELKFTTKTNGNGLGLPYVKKLVNAYKGTLDVHSSLDEGTSFILVFPSK